jgi:hypothetical protein
MLEGLEKFFGSGVSTFAETYAQTRCLISKPPATDYSILNIELYGKVKRKA